jgi:hemerythrin-like domain-containing protein
LVENIFDKIIEEHQEFRDMVSNLEKGKGNEEDTFSEFRKELIAHIEAEEKTLYQSLTIDKKGKEMALVGTEEHRMGSVILHKLDNATGEDWVVQVVVLKHLLEKHMEVEEAEVIPMAKKMLDPSRLSKISQDFESIEQKLEE